jgi:hypothetical protein
MRTRVVDVLTRLVLFVLALVACDKSKQEATPAASVRSATTSAPAVQPPAEPAPGGCKAMGRQRVELATALGTAHGLVADKSYLYLTTWQIYGARGDLLRIRKDGEGNNALASLELEPRGLAVDDNYVFFTEGIRLKRVQKKEGGVAAMADAKFSSQAIALDAEAVYGVPGDYGPYDRVVKLAKAGGVSTELADAPRPDLKKGPVGYSALAVDATGIYVTDSGHGRVLKFALKGGNPTTLAARQHQAFDLALVGSHLYFTLAKQGKIRRVSTAGGAVTEIASGLVQNARIAADSKIVVGTFSGGKEGAPLELAKVPADGGARTAITSIPASNTVEVLTLDDDCVYWVERESGAGKLMVYGRAR